MYLPAPLVSSSQLSFSSDSRANPRGEEIWRHPPRNIHSEGRKCGAAGRDSKLECLVEIYMYLQLDK